LGGRLLCTSISDSIVSLSHTLLHWSFEIISLDHPVLRQTVWAFVVLACRSVHSANHVLESPLSAGTVRLLDKFNPVIREEVSHPYQAAMSICNAACHGQPCMASREPPCYPILHKHRCVVQHIACGFLQRVWCLRVVYWLMHVNFRASRVCFQKKI
jgi:hypothetical protein